MAAEITLCKSDERPWGFRLTGGRDFGTPLTVIKVGVDTIAEQAGMKVGDILVRINNEACHGLTHRQVQDTIHKGGNMINLSVLRGSLTLSGQVLERLSPSLPLQEFVQQVAEQEAAAAAQQEPAQVVDTNIEVLPIKDLDPEQLQQLGLKPLPGDFLEKAMRDPSPLPQVLPQTCQTPVPEILQVLEDLGLPEVVQDIVEHREELLNTEQPQQQSQEISESAEVEQVAAPQSAVEPTIPRTEEEIAEVLLEQVEVIEGTNALGVNFMKYETPADFIKKSEVLQTLNETGAPQEVGNRRWTTFLEKPNRPIIKPKPKPKMSKAATPLPEPEQEPEPEPERESNSRQGLYEMPSQEEFEELVKIPEPVEEPLPTEPEDGTVLAVPAEVTDDTEHTAEELIQQQQELEQQLAAEQPLTVEEKSDIELQLEEIQRQLEAIQQLPFEIQQHLSMVQEQLTKIVQLKHEQELQHQLEEAKLEEQVPDQPEQKEQEPEQTEVQPETQESVPETAEPEFKLRAIEDEPILPPEKKPKKERTFAGLGPAPRPLILPGGRKWRTPKDAYNDEFIAETLSAQAEIITGSTLGVNFRKYEPKHPNLEFLKESNVYKMVHDLEDITGGLAERPEIVPALQDYIQATPAAI